MKKLIFIFLFTLNIFALDIIIAPEKLESVDIGLGDYFSAKVYFISRDEVKDVENVLKLMQTRQIGPFQIITFDNIQASENNSDVISVEVKLVQTLPATIENSVLEFEGQKIQLKFQNFIPSVKAMEGEKFIAEQFLDEEKAAWLKLGIAVIAVVFFGFIIYFLFFRSRDAIDKVRDPFKESQKLFYQANDRKGYERLFRDRKIWLPYVDKQKGDEFLNLINAIQFKEVWNEGELELVQELFSKLELKKDV